MTPQALADLTVVECAQGVAGPFCAKALADLGAEVIKVEPPEGDASRRHGPFPGDRPHPERSGQFLYLNANKRGITLNLEADSGRHLLRQLVARADILIIDLPPGRLEELELDYPRLQPLNRKLIMTCISPFGQAGPYRDYKGTDLTLFHVGGMGRETPYNQVTDLDAQPPLKGGGYQAEYLLGWTAAAATMAAVLHRAVSGEGQMVDVAGMEAVASMLRFTLAMLSYNPARVQGRLKSGFPWILPCKDGYVSFSPFHFDHWWAGFKEMMGRPEWAESELFSTMQGRLDHADALEALAVQWMAQHTKGEIYAMALERGLPCFPVNTIGEVVNSPQLTSRGFFVDVEHPEAGSVRQPGPPVRFHGTPWRIARPAPRLGEHNEEVLCLEQGLSREELDRLRRSGAV